MTRDERDVGERLDVLDERRPAAQAALGGPGRGDPRARRPPLEVREHRRLLAADVAARRRPELHAHAACAAGARARRSRLERACVAAGATITQSRAPTACAASVAPSSTRCGVSVEQRHGPSRSSARPPCRSPRRSGCARRPPPRAWSPSGSPRRRGRAARESPRPWMSASAVARVTERGTRRAPRDAPRARRAPAAAARPGGGSVHRCDLAARPRGLEQRRGVPALRAHPEASGPDGSQIARPSAATTSAAAVPASAARRGIAVAGAGEHGNGHRRGAAEAQPQHPAGADVRPRAEPVHAARPASTRRRASARPARRAGRAVRAAGS